VKGAKDCEARAGGLDEAGTNSRSSVSALSG